MCQALCSMWCSENLSVEATMITCLLYVLYHTGCCLVLEEFNKNTPSSQGNVQFGTWGRKDLIQT